jgi:hypothetical protein
MKNEKSNYVVIFNGFNEHDEYAKKNYTLKPPSKIHNFLELEKNHFEVQAIKAIIRKYQKMLKENGFNIFFDPDISRIHITTKKEYREKIDKNNSGKFQWGDIYVFRSDNKSYFIGSLVHQLAHMLSYYEIAVTKSASGSFGLESKQSGIHKTDRSLKLDDFLGLNEALAETITRDICHRLCENNVLLNDEETLKLLGGMSYQNHIKMVNVITANKHEDKQKTMMIFLHSFIFGDEEFLNTLTLTAEQLQKLKEVGRGEEEAKNFITFLTEGAN